MVSTRISDPNKQGVIDKWKTSDSADYKYFDAVETNLGSFWADGQVFRRLFDRLDLESVVEIACGKGRHSAQVVEKCQRLHLVDTSVDALAFTKERFSGFDHVTTHLSSDGESMPFIPDGSSTAVFSYDAMVHFELLTIAAYLSEIFRVLRPGGMALLHHSIYDRNPTGKFTDNPGWRNYLSPDIMFHLTSRSGLEIVELVSIDWSAPASDQLTLLRKPTAT